MKSYNPQEIIKALQSVLHIEQRVSGIDYLREFARNIAKTFETRYVLIGHAIKPGNEKVKTDVVWADGDFGENFVYSLKGTPCENVLSGNRVCVYPNGVADKFPADILLADMGVDSYIGAPMVSVEGQLLGILVLLDDKPVRDVDFYQAIIEFLAVRVGTELERYYFEEKLKQQVEARTLELEKSNRELHNALSEIETLQGIVPICSSCKKIRDDRGFWQQVESYISRHSRASFSHAICPECEKLYYKELNKVRYTSE